LSSKKAQLNYLQFSWREFSTTWQKKIYKNFQGVAFGHPLKMLKGHPLKMFENLFLIHKMNPTIFSKRSPRKKSKPTIKETKRGKKSKETKKSKLFTKFCRIHFRIEHF